MDIKMALEKYVDEVSSKERTPGGGSVAAISASLGCALASMVANLTFEKEAFEKLTEEHKKTFNEGFKELQEFIKELNCLAKEDTYAFEGVLEAMKLPEETEKEKKNRKQAIEEATKDALKTPLKIAKMSLKALELQDVFVRWGNTDTMSDMGVGIWTAYAGLEGALITVKINLYNLVDEKYKNRILEECEQILLKGRALRDQHLEAVYKKLD